MNEDDLTTLTNEELLNETMKVYNKQQTLHCDACELVARTLNIKPENNRYYNSDFKYDCDLFDENVYGRINVLESLLFSDNAWHFDTVNVNIPDTYVAVGFDKKQENVLHVWIAKPTDNFILPQQVTSIKNE